MNRPFRFGFQTFNAEGAKDWADQAKKAEDLGYSAFHLADHILGAGPALEKANHPEQNMAAIPAMAYAAAVTKEIKIGCRVFCVDYHLPIVLIKSAMTINMLSEGRLEFGIGAGWISEEYKALGIKMDEPKKRIDRMGDVIQGLKAFCSEGPADISNETLEWSGFSGIPKPKRRPPIMIGGGSPRVLRLAGKEADIVSLNFNNRSGAIGPDGVSLSTAEQTQKKIRWIKEGAGDRFEDLEIEIGAYFTFVTDNPAPIVGEFSKIFGMPEDQMKKHPHALFGSAEEICDELERRREIFGISYVTVGTDNLESFAPVVKKLTGK